MEKSKDGVPRSVKSKIFVENFSQLQFLDVEELRTRIETVYESIIQRSTYPTNFSRDFLAAPLMYSKSKKEADNYRKKAEQLWKVGKFKEALLPILESIAVAERDSAELASAYSDRSYILLKLEKYNSCIQDVDRASKIKDCPTGLRKKLRERKKQCLILQKNIKIDKVEDLHLKWYKSCNLAPYNAYFLPNISLKLNVCFNEKRERYLMAVADIQPGEILSIDDYYATGLDFDQRDTNCAFCLLECDSLIPCFTCAREMYCSENCRSQAFNLFHQSECKFIGFYERTTDAAPLLATRMFLIGTEQGKQLKNLMNELKPRDIFVEKYDNNSQFDDYRSALQIRRISQVSTDHVTTAVCIVIVMIRSSFFGDFDTLPDRLSSVQSYAALLLINHLVTLAMVNPRVERLQPCQDLLDSKTTERIPAEKYFEPQTIGFGISLLQSSLIRRSCYGNTSVLQQNRRGITFATRAIRFGEKLSSSAAFHKFPQWMEQHGSLSDNLFSCENDACSTNCLKIELLKNAEIPFPTLNESLKTKLRNAVMKTGAKWQSAGTLRNEEILALVIVNSNLLCEMLTLPSYDIVLCEQLVLVLMRVLYSDHHRQYKNISLGSYFYDVINRITGRIYSPYFRPIESKK